MRRSPMPRRTTPLLPAPRRASFRVKDGHDTEAPLLSGGSAEPYLRGAGIRRRSPKRAREERLYARESRAFLAAHPWCQRCGRASVCVHHRAGREGSRLRDQRWWAASCWGCNTFAETETGRALAEGWLLSYINPGGAA